MPSFEFCTSLSVRFGRGLFDQVGSIASPLGRRVLVVTNADPDGTQGLHERLAGNLDAAGLAHRTLRVKGEPSIETVEQGVATARDHRTEVVVSVGGGSAMDTGKAIAGLLANGGTVLDYLEIVGAGRKLTERALPHVAVPTTAGTGSEVTKNAVIGCGEKHVKASLRSPLLLPAVALVDPAIQTGVPAEVTAWSGMDALVQLAEAYTSKSSQPLTDVLAVEGVGRCLRSLERAFACGDDLDAREDMAFAALLGGMCLANAGLGAVHGLAAPLGAMFDAPHGAVCAALVAPVTRVNLEALARSDIAGETLRRHARLGRLVAPDRTLDDREAIELWVARLDQLTRSLCIPSLSRWGVHRESLPAVAAAGAAASSMRHNPIALSRDELVRILTAAL